MAEYRGRGAARNHQHLGQPANVPLFPDPERRNRQLCLDTGRALVLCGALVTIPTAFDSGPTNAHSPVASTAFVFAGFLLWILGACLCLLALTPAAPWAVRAGAAVASAVLKCLCPPVAVNY